MNQHNANQASLCSSDLERGILRRSLCTLLYISSGPVALAVMQLSAQDTSRNMRAFFSIKIMVVPGEGSLPERQYKCNEACSWPRQSLRILVIFDVFERRPCSTKARYVRAVPLCMNLSSRVVRLFQSVGILNLAAAGAGC